jgi:hypothetical protein
MASPVPGYGPETYSRENSDAQAGTPVSFDPTAELGQTPDSLFGVRLPQGTGAPGSQGASPGTADPTNEPGQLTEAFSGEGPAQIAETGAPGSQGATFSTGGPDSVRFTRPGSYASGTYQSDTVQDHVSGTSDWTQANDFGYGSGGPQLPGIRGNEPVSTGAGDGRVLRGGRSVS